jgi:hypothetical protein
MNWLRTTAFAASVVVVYVTYLSSDRIKEIYIYAVLFHSECSSLTSVVTELKLKGLHTPTLSSSNTFTVFEKKPKHINEIQ